jgi:glutaminyl-tRNA synthetase
MSEPETTAQAGSDDFIREIIRGDLAAGRHQTVVTRFPPEPNGYLHIGHAKSACLNFGVAREFGGHCSLRFDDTNPIKEEMEYIEAIQRDVRWLGFDWGEHLHFTSDYFEQLYEWAEHLIRQGKAYVDDLSAEEIRAYRGTLTEAGRDSPHRTRSPEENLDLFRRMRAGEFPDGARVLRAKIDMASGNMNLRDPVLYRILHAHHPRTGDAWSIYPTYDFGHGQSDAIEQVTHSICTLEFEDHRPLYDWLIENLPVPSRPRQYEFSRLNLSYTVLSKRRLIQLVQEGHVTGWDDPRMPTLSGLPGDPAGGDPRLRRAYRRDQERKHRRGRAAGTLHPRAAEQNGPAPHGGAAPAQGSHRELSRGGHRTARGHQQSGGPGRRQP